LKIHQALKKTTRTSQKRRNLCYKLATKQKKTQVALNPSSSGEILLPKSTICCHQLKTVSKPKNQENWFITRLQHERKKKNGVIEDGATLQEKRHRLGDSVAKL
jgi:hypothetical protein